MGANILCTWEHHCIWTGSVSTSNRFIETSIVSIERVDHHEEGDKRGCRMATVSLRRQKGSDITVERRVLQSLLDREKRKREEKSSQSVWIATERYGVNRLKEQCDEKSCVVLCSAGMSSVLGISLSRSSKRCFKFERRVNCQQAGEREAGREEENGVSLGVRGGEYRKSSEGNHYYPRLR